jgi:hypothetical protein
MIPTLSLYYHLGENIKTARLRRNTTLAEMAERTFMTRSDAIPVDPVQLPLTAQEFNTQGLFGAFQDATPDEWGTHLLDRAAE